jgi:hypothetical protein
LRALCAGAEKQRRRTAKQRWGCRIVAFRPVTGWPLLGLSVLLRDTLRRFLRSRFG